MDEVEVLEFAVERFELLAPDARGRVLAYLGDRYPLAPKPGPADGSSAEERQGDGGAVVLPPLSGLQALYALGRVKN